MKVRWVGWVEWVGCGKPECFTYPTHLAYQPYLTCLTYHRQL